MFSKIFSSKLINSVLSLVGGVVVSYLTKNLPLTGVAMNLTEDSCGTLAGFPFSFTRHYVINPESHFPNPFCSLDFDIIAFIINAIFWFAVLLFALLYLNKLLKRKLVEKDETEK